MSFAVIQTGGKQYKVSASEILRIERLENPEGLIKPNLNARLSVMDYFNPEAIMIPLRRRRRSWAI